MAYQGEIRPPCCRPPSRTWLQGWLCKVLGFVVLAACAAVSVSLLTWSAADPSLTHATSGGARNLLGPLGAILSDMLMQMLGLAGMFAFSAAAVLGLAAALHASASPACAASLSWRRSP